MNYRQKSKLNGSWAFIKYDGNAAIYAVCQNCGFTYPCYKNNRFPDGAWSFGCSPDLDKVFHYCPNCGLKMHLFDGEEVYKMENSYL